MFAQDTYQVSGILIDDLNEGVPFANVLLLRSIDSTLVKGVLTKENGEYSISNIPEDSYYIRGSFIGYQTNE